ncbi:MAG: hypothetical protein Q4F65_05815 [Propionibacteriaceae bacterium]|nr:hypothetical protein [Propionibacteriaceae bacterium]
MDLIPSSEMKNRIPGTTDGFWAQRRYRGDGPTFIKLGRKVFYRPEDVDAWIADNLHERTDRKAN